MSNINFVPDDYVQNNESRRTNLMCVILFVLVMSALGGVFTTILMRKKACTAEEALLNAEVAQKQEEIRKVEELQSKRKEMMKTALTTAELLEPVPRSILLATLTNNLPAGTSLVDLNIVQKEAKEGENQGTQKSSAKASGTRKKAIVSPEKRLESCIDIGGITWSDLQVAEYIQRLEDCTLLNNITLIESKECKVKDEVFRQFKLKAKLCREVHLTNDDVEQIRVRAEESTFNF
jgi:Tfp pilus assembly protein PilN